MYRLDMYSGASFAKEPVHEQTFIFVLKLFSTCSQVVFCRLIILTPFNFWSVVRVVSG